jgi:hypothetical protein
MTPNNTYTARYDLQAGMAATQSGTATRRRARRPGGGAAYFSTLKAKKIVFPIQQTN